MDPIYIVAAKRTPIGAFSGALSTIAAAKLGAIAIEGAIAHCGIDKSYIDEVITGNVINAGQGMGPGRQASILAGIPETTPAYSVNMICGSGMKSIMDAAAHIRASDADIVVACGMENMSQIPYLLPNKIRSGIKLGHQTMEDALIKDGLTDAFQQYHMGVTAENIADKYAISREQQDAFAVQSQHKAGKAISDNTFADEIVPVSISSRKGQVWVNQDEYPKPETNIDTLASLRPAFKKEGTVTAGNASGLNDGAATLILASKEAVEKHHLQPIAEIVSYAQAGVAPEYMGLGPVPAIEKALNKSNCTLDDIEVIELNEAFAAQALGVMTALSDQHKVPLNILQKRTNPNGGAIALGHPLGASGTRILVSLLHELKRSQKQLGLASLCIGGGMGTAVIVRRLSDPVI